MNITFRWYGRDNDTVSLADVKQIPNVKGIVWALHKTPVGEIWSKEEIQSEVAYIRSFDFHAEVVESVNVHESIKLGLPERDRLIENYKQTLLNLSEVGVKVVCYNFMPIFDWTRTSLFHPNEDGSTSLFFEAEKIKNIDPMALLQEVKENSHLTLPGWDHLSKERLQILFEQYKSIDEHKLWENLAYFLNEVAPFAEKVGIHLGIHPDDPPWTIFGLPRIITGYESYMKLKQITASSGNQFTLCTGSLGANPNNDLLSIFNDFIKDAPFLHLRNVKTFENGDFIETSHRTADGSIDMAGIVKILAENNYSGYVRPDHGRHIWGEKSRAGYGLYDRALGIMYLNGLWDAYMRNE
ncbi:mannonate dehydratase [Solibacillus sp. FSL K6-4121]|uniref:mannonate dehydratase n=1 Tax=Solibacillus sp. FSL K6-4121 TaxID=2921505 RepID=UPI0030F720BE